MRDFGTALANLEATLTYLIFAAVGVLVLYATYRAMKGLGSWVSNPTDDEIWDPTQSFDSNEHEKLRPPSADRVRNTSAGHRFNHPRT